jgi:hypothetical protein
MFIARIDKHKIFLSFFLLIAFILPLFSIVKNADSDPRGSLLLSQTILTNKTIKLDHFGNKFLENYGYRIENKNGHFYYSFPIGTSIISLPFVRIANSLGYDMADPRSETEVQTLISSLTVMFTLLFLFKLSNIFLNNSNSLILSCTFLFGTSLISTSGTALWSHNISTLFGLISIYLSFKSICEKNYNLWALISLFLFGAYLCRPTFALLPPMIIIFLFTYSRSAALKVFTLLVFLVVGFILFSMKEFGQILPDYYLPHRLEGGSFWVALYGNLFSPSRGLFIYSPFLLAIWACFQYSEKNWKFNRSWFLIAAVWPVVHLVMISRFPHWWAGWSYGPRLMTDVMPGLFLLSIYTWPTNYQNMLSKFLIALLVITSALSIFINTRQGLFNRYVSLWNSEPGIDEFRKYLFDWKYPQFMANKLGHEDRLIRHLIYLNKLISGEILNEIPNSTNFNHKSQNIDFVGWNDAEHLHRWSTETSEIVFHLDNHNTLSSDKIRLFVGTNKSRHIEVFLNGHEVYRGIVLSWYELIDITCKSSYFIDGNNILKFHVRDPQEPTMSDPRVLGLAFKYLQIW